MSHTIHLAGVYDGVALDSAIREFEGGYVVAYQTTKRAGMKVPNLVNFEERDNIFPSQEAAFAASRKSLKSAIEANRI
ncbi:hypothetical protein LMA00_07675 [Burkholderia ambifaria]|uniref:hypothetical protein n=1 Tax=Burkholderia ambifaria TaxID=152480 RepID=UPI001E2E5706|nr:hypothetical protein [Burkholderia ambifaria]UEP49617.1 hypothetical protein LMA00_07675 [Burkholderia ambifaria]